MTFSDTTFLQYGAIGLLALVSVTFAWFLYKQSNSDRAIEAKRAGDELARETARADRNEIALRELNEGVQERVIPAAIDMISTTRQLLALMAVIQQGQR